MLAGGAMIVVRGKAKSLLNEEKTAQGTLGNWLAAHLQHKGRNIIIINLHRIPSSSQCELTHSVTQCNRNEGEAKSTNNHRIEALH